MKSRFAVPLVGLCIVLWASAAVAATPLWYEFRFHGTKVGHLEAEHRSVTIDGKPALYVRQSSVVSVRRQAHEIRLEATTEAWTEPDGRPIRFRHSRNEAGAIRTVTGERVGQELVIHTDVGGQKSKRRFPIDKHLFLASTTEVVFKDRVGPKFKMQGQVIVEEDGQKRPFSMKTVESKGDRHTVESVVANVTSLVTFDRQRNVEKITSPQIGAEFVRVSKTVAQRIEHVTDIFSAARLETGVPLPRGARLERLVFRLRGERGRPPMPVMGEHQKLRQLPQNAVEVKVRVQRPPATAPRLPIRTPAMAQYLKATPYEPLNAPELQAAARQIQAGRDDAWLVAKQINRFVHDHIANKSLAKAYSTAAEALKAKEGDCTEHAVLFAALAKIVGIPTRLATGLVGIGGAKGYFGYHQWVEVWMGEGWIAMDPTFGQDIADPTHIKFTQGSSDPDGLRDAGIAAAGLFSGVKLSVTSYTTTDGKRVKF